MEVINQSRMTGGEPYRREGGAFYQATKVGPALFGSSVKNARTPLLHVTHKNDRFRCVQEPSNRKSNESCMPLAV